jgi:hypothetical protein
MQRKTTEIGCLELTHNCTKYNGYVVEIATYFNILYDSPEDGHQMGRNMSR